MEVKSQLARLEARVIQLENKLVENGANKTRQTEKTRILKRKAIERARARAYLGWKKVQGVKPLVTPSLSE